MPEYQKAQKSRERQDHEPQDDAPAEGDPQGQAVSATTEDLLDEIDSVLEENAETFVANYVQKGGQ